jgi:hypothetical protein
MGGWTETLRRRSGPLIERPAHRAAGRGSARDGCGPGLTSRNGNTDGGSADQATRKQGCVHDPALLHLRYSPRLSTSQSVEEVPPDLLCPQRAA